MSSGFVDRQVKSSLTGHVIGQCVAGGSLILCLAIYWTDVRSLFSPYVTVDRTSLATNASELVGHNVTVHADEVSPVGDEVEEDKYGVEHRTDATFVLARLGDKALLIRAPKSSTQTEFSGILMSFSDVGERAAEETKKALGPAADALLPYQVDAATGHFWTVVSLLGGIGALIFLFRWHLYVKRLKSNPAEHPILKRLALYGDIAAITTEIDREVNTKDQMMIANIRVTPHWLVHPGMGANTFLPFRELLWAYPTQTRHYTNGIPMNRSYGVALCTRFGETRVPLKRDKVNTFLEKIGSRAPWAFIGYNEEIQRLFTGPNRGRLLEIVEERRRGFEVMQPVRL